MKEITIKTQNPFAADDLLQNYGIIMQGGGKGKESEYVKDKRGNYKARALNPSGDTSFAKFAMAKQGYNIEIID